MLVKVAKEFRWEMGHRLPAHDGPCTNIHGHSYRMTVELIGTLNKEGMVLDYGHIKNHVDPLIESLDHGFLIHEEDLVMKDFLTQNKMKMICLKELPTAENISIWFLQKLKPVFSEYSNIKTLTIKICETQSALAEVSTEL